MVVNVPGDPEFPPAGSSTICSWRRLALVFLGGRAKRVDDLVSGEGHRMEFGVRVAAVQNVGIRSMATC